MARRRKGPSFTFITKEQVRLWKKYARLLAKGDRVAAELFAAQTRMGKIPIEYLPPEEQERVIKEHLPRLAEADRVASGIFARQMAALKAEERVETKRPHKRRSTRKGKK